MQRPIQSPPPTYAEAMVQSPRSTAEQGLTISELTPEIRATMSREPDSVLFLAPDIRACEDQHWRLQFLSSGFLLFALRAALQKKLERLDRLWRCLIEGAQTRREELESLQDRNAGAKIIS